ncbi:hypothetical protein RJ639_040434 [Escallonia herrerae]|uniref:Dilute domain-containing protein n=1 Tax=Escallonia herrerae TaxID=1293975 RepID=A0AA89B5W7_9ASTE|nr:hypothetical protein RJ639_040434 [Escallonia herrerae]
MHNMSIILFCGLSVKNSAARVVTIAVILGLPILKLNVIFNAIISISIRWVPPVHVQKISTQTFSYINVQLFNNKGEYVKSGLAELELWFGQFSLQFSGSSWEELKHVRHAVGFLVCLYFSIFFGN